MLLPLTTIGPARRGSEAVGAERAAALVVAGAFVLDLRTAQACEQDGHLPGAHRLPHEALASAPGLVPEDGRPVLLVCDDGSRSRRAAVLLAEAGLPNVAWLAGGMARWPGARETGRVRAVGPSAWLLANASLAPRGARTLDVACGRGRHALLLASAGSLVRAVDRDAARVRWLEAVARRLRLPVEARVVDLEQDLACLGEEEWELVLVFRYLQRSLFPMLVRALRPGGVLLCETFARGQGRRERSIRPERLLEPGELVRLVAPLEVVRQREGELDGDQVASVAARKPTRGARRPATSHASAARSVAPVPRTQSRPASARAGAPGVSSKSTPGARKR
ncbi:MAG: rhodanese-like domain-containing protein [Betaproteobacteria bacterium]